MSVVCAVALIGFALFMREAYRFSGAEGKTLAQGDQCAKNDVLPTVQGAEDSDTVYFVGCGGFF